MAYAPADILQVFRRANDEIGQAAAKPRSVSVKSCGTKTLLLNAQTSSATGSWLDASLGTSKPPRWIVHIEQDASGHWSAKPSGGTLGYFNVSDAKTQIVVVRVLASLKSNAPATWRFPDGWECLLFLTLKEVLKSPSAGGGSSVTVTDFDPTAMTVKSSGRTYHVAHAAIVRGPDPSGAFEDLSYDEAVGAVVALTGAKLYDGRDEASMVALGRDVDAALGAITPRPPGAASGPFVLAALSTLIGVDPMVYRQVEAAVNSGKRHIIFYGPPGTGKTTIAEYAAEELALWERGDGAYVMLTASTAWTAQDLVGGYQPVGEGKIEFVAGALLRDFDKPVVIDELNRAPVDKVLGPLFSVLSGQASTLPYRVDVTKSTSEFHQVVPKAGGPLQPHEHAPGPAWHLLATLNTYDKTQLGQISYALSRRFAWIEVPPPTDRAAFVRDHLSTLGPASHPDAPNPVAAMWDAVNAVRPIGAAPIIDFISTVKSLNPTVDFQTMPTSAAWDALLGAFGMCVLPLLDGLAPSDMARLAQAIATAWALDPGRVAALAAACSQFEA
jgi:MoxR-like ATPase